MNHLKEIMEIANHFEPKKKALPYLELDSMMLSQVVEVAHRVAQNDINNTHIQNWVKRKYLPNPQKKKYTREQVANILLINDLRNILSLEEASQLLSFVNLNLEDNSDDRINPAKLYRYYSEIFDLSQKDWVTSLEQLPKEVNQILAGEDLSEDDKDKVAATLVILDLLARANLYKQIAQQWLKNISRAGTPGEES
ncbi:DUF1836 domain-containing protein [Desulfitobacterium hafniense]|uniref:DUF1836 domain-containing protein n=5 Tax=root TaxID=1 RepID=Q24WQ4_DESHY|nr:DUF1836 domain-containing protein [Desulfitobacterium hafniense]ACL20924.1 Domain of unknown function DUF1836 [Desulfitobacterium hafniense DCB-2]KTE91198.1 hypothetical protein AT727_06290 [Desulfitobacterium hafniense]MEA5023889.1 DUF1836 domain-containing protein [Desulfitobacterium hafniense]CDX01811.1 DUF1836 domain protein [Desulfitobacterium hafniense]BAE83538.1 hypothetical protein DSY1749 [Desulfitobacterium hafniense Y51]